MKKVNKIMTMVFFATFSIFFIIGMMFWYHETEELYEYDNFKQATIKNFHDNPSEFQKNYKYKIKDTGELSDEIIDDIYQKSRKWRFVFLISASLPLSLVASVLLLGPIFIILSIVKKYNKYRLSVDDFKQNKGYYRDLLKDYNPLELSYNNNYNLDNNSLFAMVLYLQKKKALSLNDNKFVINDVNTINLDKQFIDCIKISDSGKLEVPFSQIANLTDQSCKKKKLLIMGNIPKRKFVFDLLKSVMLYVVLYIVWSNLNTIYEMIPPIESTLYAFSSMALFILLFLFIYVYPFVALIKLSLLYVATNIEHPKKTDLGNEINYKLEGLKNFIRDFSELDEREKEEVVLWDDYLVYSVLFGDNKKISSDMEDKVKYTYSNK